MISSTNDTSSHLQKNTMKSAKKGQKCPGLTRVRPGLNQGYTLTSLFGPPGSGKTRTLVRWAKRGVEKYGANRVVIASLTKAAAVEIASRIEGEGITINPSHVGTLHSLCYRQMGGPELMTGKLVEEFNARYSTGISANSKDKTNTDVIDLTPGGSDDDRTLAQIDLLRARMIDEALWPASVLSLWTKWCAFKLEFGAVDFTDMIEFGRTTDCAPGRPEVIIYDEAQDGSRLELELIRHWASTATNTVIAGDDDQALYSWRGASVRAFVDFSESQQVLGRSYRLPAILRDYAQKWVEQISERKRKEYEPNREGGEIIRREDITLAYADGIMPGLQQNIAAGKSTMILATCQYQLNGVVAMLLERGIPFSNLYRVKNGAWNPLPRGGKRRTTILDRIDALKRTPWSWEDLHKWTGELRSGDALKRGAKAEIVRRKKEAGIVNFHDLDLLLKPEVIEAALAWDLRAWAKWIKSSSKTARTDYIIRVAEETQVDVHEAKRLVTVGTIHSVKGAESDTVYLFPDLSPAAMDQYEGVDRDGILRVFYVGLTRARDKIVLCGASPRSRGRAVQWI